METIQKDDNIASFRLTSKCFVNFTVACEHVNNSTCDTKY